jgi:predicted  nucleic acid-binding Zn-ribbon protein
VTDPVLSVCPECGKDTFKKLPTAAGFQLKGSGWYATDFKHSGPKAAAAKKDADAKQDGESKPDAGSKQPEAAPAASGAGSGPTGS